MVASAIQKAVGWIPASAGECECAWLNATGASIDWVKGWNPLVTSPESPVRHMGRISDWETHTCTGRACKPHSRSQTQNLRATASPGGADKMIYPWR